MKWSSMLKVSAISLSVITTVSAKAGLGEPEIEDLKFGFIKLTDMAPLAVAYEQGFFEDEGLYVALEAQANWKVLLDRVIDGELDGAHMLAGQPLGATIGIGTKAEVITAFSMDLNGNAITVSNDTWEQMKQYIPKQPDGKPVHPIKADSLKPVVDSYRDKGKSFNMGMVFPVSTHNYELRYWLAAGGIHPGFYAPDSGDNSGQLDADVLLSVTPPPQMPATMEAGTIKGYCVGEPWNQQAVFKGIGTPVVTDYEIWKNNPEKVFGVSKAWAEKNPNTHIRVVKALIRAAHWLDALTRAHLQDALMKIQAELNNTVIMITHDVDEAVLLSDKIVMMTNGPAATIGEVLEVNLPRPRERVALADDAQYQKCRQAVLKFLYEKQSKTEIPASKEDKPKTAAQTA